MCYPQQPASTFPLNAGWTGCLWINTGIQWIYTFLPVFTFFYFQHSAQTTWCWVFLSVLRSDAGQRSPAPASASGTGHLWSTLLHPQNVAIGMHHYQAFYTLGEIRPLPIRVPWSGHSFFRRKETGCFYHMGQDETENVWSLPGHQSHGEDRWTPSPGRLS